MANKETLKYVRETWPIEQMSHKLRRGDEGSNGEFFPRTVDQAVLCVLQERLFKDGYPVYENTAPWTDPATGTTYEAGELIIERYLPDGTENPLYDDLTIPREVCMINEDTDLHEALNGLEERMIYMEQSGVGIDSVGKEQLKEGAVDNRALGNGAVTSEKIQDGTIRINDMSDGAVETIIKRAAEDGINDSKTIKYDADSKKLEVREEAIGKEHFREDAFDEHYDITSTNAVQNRILTATIGATNCDESQAGTTADNHGLKLEKGDAVKKSDLWMVGEDAAIVDVTSVSAVIDHIINTDIETKPTETTEQPVFIDETGKEVTLEELLNSSTELKEAVQNDVNETIGTKLQDYTYNKADIDGKIAQAGKVKDVKVDGASVVDTAGIANITLTTKADKADTYTKTETDDKIDEAVKIVNIKVPNSTDPSQVVSLTITNKEVTIPYAKANQYGLVKFGSWDALKLGEVPNPTDVVTKVNAKIDAADVYNKIDSDNKYMPKTQKFKTVGGQSILGEGNIPVGELGDVVTDVKLPTGTIVTDGVANLPYASKTGAGVVFVTDDYKSNIENTYILPSCKAINGLNTVVNGAADNDEFFFEQSETGINFNSKAIDGTAYSIEVPAATTNSVGVTKLYDAVEGDVRDVAVTPNAVYQWGVHDVKQKKMSTYEHIEKTFTSTVRKVSVNLQTISEYSYVELTMPIAPQLDSSVTELRVNLMGPDDMVCASDTFDLVNLTPLRIEVPANWTVHKLEIVPNGAVLKPVLTDFDIIIDTNIYQYTSIVNTDRTAFIEEVDLSGYQKKLTDAQMAVLNCGITAELVNMLKEFLEGDARVIKRMTQAEYDAMADDKKAITLAIIKD